VVVVIPAYNPSGKLITLTEEIRSLFSPLTVIVNDGSEKECETVFSALESCGCHVLTHERNMGKGAALKTAVRHILSACPDAAGIVTADADGQHLPEDIFRLAQRLTEQRPAEEPEGIILGVRDFYREDVPFKSRWGNRITSAVFFPNTGVSLSDTQTGLRGIPMNLAAMYAQAKGDRFEFEMNALLEACKMKIPLFTIPISTVYSENNRGSHFRAVRDSARIYWDIIKFAFSSGVCAGLDFALFMAFSSFAFGQDPRGVVISAVLARLVSGMCNFCVNRFFVFGCGKKGASVRYLLLFLAQMLISAELTAFITRIGLFAPIAKLIVDSALWAVSFVIQKKFIFRREKS
jgi:glycosyltransferase involved in cell wall biosynthesis